MRPIFRRHAAERAGALSAALALFVVLGTGSAVATELRDAELVAGASPVLQNSAGTVRIQDARLGRLGPPVFLPEPGLLMSLASGTGLLALLARRRASGKRGA